MPKFRVYYTTTYVRIVESDTEEGAIEKAHMDDLSQWQEQLDGDTEAEEITDDE